MTMLKDILDVAKLKVHLEERIVRAQVHPNYPELFILNYTELAQFGRIWDGVTNVCRGLIVKKENDWDTAELVARAFNKFHNLNTDYAPETLEENLPSTNGVPEIPQVTEKLDGSLGIIYFYDDRHWVATRGSFDSEQARWATTYLREHVRDNNLLQQPFPEGWTPVCEIIYAANRIVVTYDFEGLVLLGFVDPVLGIQMNRHGAERAATLVGLPIVKKFKKSLSECVAENTPNTEGYVLTYSNNVKVKVKFAEYVRLHRILTGLSPIAIWEMLRDNQREQIDTLLNDPKIAEGFKEWLTNWNNKLLKDFSEIAQFSQHLHDEAKGNGLVHTIYSREQRKSLAAFVMKQTEAYPYQKGLQFALADKKDISSDIWGLVRPNGRAVDTFKKEGE